MHKKDKVSIDVKLIEQEHRFIHVFKNYFHKWGESDPRKEAAGKALKTNLFSWFLRLFVLGSVVSIGGFSLYFMFKQTELMAENNESVKLQIKQSAEQFEKSMEQLVLNTKILEEEFRINKNVTSMDVRFRLLEYLYSGKELTESLQKHKYGLYTELVPNYSSRLRGQAVIDLINLERPIVENRLNKFKENLEYPISESPDTPFRINFNSLLLQETIFNRTDFSDVDFSHSSFHNSSCFDCDFGKATLSNVNFENAKLVNSNFSGTDLSGSNMRGANLNIIKWDKNTKVIDLNLTGIKSAPQGFVKFAKQNGAVFSDSEWEKRKSIFNRHFGF